MKHIIAVMMILIAGCNSYPEAKHYQVNKTTAVVRCKGDKCGVEFLRKHMRLDCENPVEIDNGYGDNSGYWLLYSCYKCGT